MDGFGNPITETTFTDGEFGTIYPLDRKRRTRHKAQAPVRQTAYGSFVHFYSGIVQP